MLSLMTAVGFGVVDPDAAFAGLGNAAVVTVAAVLAISHALGRSGVVDLVGDRVMALARNPFGQMVSLCLLGAFLSGFMNNVGALALLRSEEHTSELQSLMRTSYAFFCLKKKKNQKK